MGLMRTAGLQYFYTSLPNCSEIIFKTPLPDLSPE